MSAAGLSALNRVHPHHVTRIREMAGALASGTVVVVNSGRETGSFYTGIKNGDRAIVASEGHLFSVARTDLDGARLVCREDEVLAVDPESWDYVEIRRAKEAALTAATAQMERAYASANGLLGAPEGDEHAIASLLRARELRDYAFALQVWAEYEREQENYERNQSLREALREQVQA